MTNIGRVVRSLKVNSYAEVMTLAKNVGRLATIAALVPDQEIRTESFERHYPSKSFLLMVINCLTSCEAHAHDQADIDEFIADVSH